MSLTPSESQNPAVALKEANDRLQFAVQSSGFGIWETQVSTGRLTWDERMFEIYGVSEADFHGQLDDWLRLIHPEDLKNLMKSRTQVMEGQVETFDLDFRIVRPDGIIRNIEARGMVIRDSAGAPARFVGLNRDITARKKLEDRLRHSEEISIHVSRLAQIGAWELGAANREMRWEPELFRICEVELGYEPTLAKMTEFFPDESRSHFTRAIDDAFSDGNSFDFESPFDTARGWRRWVRVFGQAEFRDGQPVRLFGALQDITVRREAEEGHRQLQAQLFQAQKMDTLGTLAGGIAHDFNNLLTGIIGYQDLALESIPEGNTAKECLTEAREASRRACGLVEQILLFSRQSDAKQYVPLDFGALIEEARRFLRSTVPTTIEIEVKIASGCGAVLGDPVQINQVLLNLGSNSAHAMKWTGGTLTIELRPVELDAAQAATRGNLPAGPYLRLDVLDTGQGMSAETQKRIFDPFFTTKAVGEGTGLGLAIVHAVVRTHGGAIEVNSAFGKGTAFTLYFPVADAEKPAAATVAVKPLRGQGELVCIVDDEQVVSRAAALMLEKYGYRSVVFNTSLECLKSIKLDPGLYSLLVTDQTMPGMTGVELASEVRAFAPDLPILIMSGYFSKVSPGALDQIPRVSLVAKPFTAAQLSRAVHAALHPAPPSD